MTELLADYELGPWGPRHDDFRAGMIATVCAAPYRKPGSRSLGPDDFFPDPAAESPLKWQTAAEQKSIMRLWAMAKG